VTIGEASDSGEDVGLHDHTLPWTFLNPLEGRWTTPDGPGHLRSCLWPNNGLYEPLAVRQRPFTRDRGRLANLRREVVKDFFSNFVSFPFLSRSVGVRHPGDAPTSGETWVACALRVRAHTVSSFLASRRRTVAIAMTGAA
jgi:hypothetical protein